jgi:cell division protein ZapA (FtsZ GTPase activity inhibitor)
LDQLLTIEVLGQPFTFKTDSNEADAKAVADYVVNAVNSIHVQGSSKAQSLDKRTIFILAALNIANDYFVLNKKHQELLQNLYRRSEKLIDVLETQHIWIHDDVLKRESNFYAKPKCPWPVATAAHRVNAIQAIGVIPLLCAWLEDVLWPNTKKNGSQREFWWASSACTEKPKETARHPPDLKDQRPVNTAFQWGFTSSLIRMAGVEVNGSPQRPLIPFDPVTEYSSFNQFELKAALLSGAFRWLLSIRPG